MAATNDWPRLDRRHRTGCWFLPSLMRRPLVHKVGGAVTPDRPTRSALACAACPRAGTASDTTTLSPTTRRPRAAAPPIFDGSYPSVDIILFPFMGVKSVVPYRMFAR